MLKIRLQRVARKHIPIFRVVLTESQNSTKSGRAHEVLGTYNLMTDEKRVDVERVKYWISKGAQPSDTLHNFFVSERIIEGKKINVLPKHRPIKPAPSKAEGKEEKLAAPEAKAPAAPAEGGAPAAEPETAKAAETPAEPAPEKSPEAPAAS